MSSVAIPLQSRRHECVGHVLVDAEDAEWLSKWAWRLVKHKWANRVGTKELCYAARQETGPDGHRRIVFMHREILGLGEGVEADHINRDGLDNRRENLRAVSHQLNMQNRPSHAGSTSKYRGVYWDKRRQRWVARIRLDGKTCSLGRFVCEEDAAAAARTARLQLFPGTVEA